MSTYLGWTIVPMPEDPASPASVEFALVSRVGVANNPFTSAQQIQDWQTEWLEASVSLAMMRKPVADAWVVWLRALDGPMAVFQFPAAVAAFVPETLMMESPLAARYWRLKGTQAKWEIRPGPWYALTFEVREAI